MYYRKEIDGLRSIAVWSVILYHAKFEFITGGFIGVDLFFVISGFLIFGQIDAQIRTDSFSYLVFYEKRLRRILPTLYFVIICTSFFSWIFLYPNALEYYSESIVSVVLFASNFLFYLKSGYFDPAAETLPLIHTWSLSVEEQFYLLFPFLTVFMYKRYSSWRCSVVFLVLCMMSWLAFVIVSQINYSASFYLLPFRVWEFVCGAFLVHSMVRSQALSLQLRNILSAMGLLLVIVGLLSISDQMQWLALYTTIPVLGILMVIAFSSEGTIAYKLLTNRWMVFSGLMSYSLYLWHQPVLVFFRVIIGSEISVIENAIGILITVLLSYGSWKYIEGPFRDRQLISASQLIISLLIGSLLLFSFGYFGYSNQGFNSRFDLPKSVVQSFSDDFPEKQCVNRLREGKENDWFCSLGNYDKSSVDFVFFGDSHATSYVAALSKLANKNNLNGIFAAETSCPPLLGVQPIRRSENISEACVRLNENIFEFVKLNNVKKVIVAARWTYYTDGGYDGSDFIYLGDSSNEIRSKQNSRMIYQRGLKNTLRRYNSIGVKPLLIEQMPQQKMDVREIYYRAYKSDAVESKVREMSVDLKEHLSLQNFVTVNFTRLEKHFEFHRFSPAVFFCEVKVCPAGTLQKSWYRDNDHIGTSGLEHIYHKMESAIMAYINVHSGELN